MTFSRMVLHVLVMMIFLNLALPSAVSMSLSKTQKNESPSDDLDVPTKRHISGSDPWSICPHTMERVECFYEYLRFYARLRKAVEVSNSVSVRNIGKRTDTLTTRESDLLNEDEILSPAISLFFLQLDDLSQNNNMENKEAL